MREQIMKAMDVSLKDEFLIDGIAYRFNPNLQYKRVGDEWFDSEIRFNKVLNSVIEKVPFKPREGELFWYVNVSGEVIIRENIKYSTSVAMLINFGNCYRTKEEAESNIKKWLEAYEGVVEK